MTKEQEAIEKLTNGEKIDFNTLIRKFKREGIENFVVTKKEYIETVLNMLKEKDKEIETLKRDFKIVDQECSRLERKEAKQDKIIDLMAERIEWLCKRNGILLDREYNENFTQEDIKQYFERKVKKCTEDG